MVFYIIKNNKGECLVTNYSGHYITNDKKIATVWIDKNKANNALANIPNKFKSKHLKVEKVFIGNEEDFEELDTDSRDDSFGVEPSKIDIEKFTHELHSSIEQILFRKKYLCSIIRGEDLRKEDLVHACEFSKLDMDKAYMLCAKMRKSRRVRRDAQKELKQIQFLLNSKLTLESIIDLEKSIEGLNHLKYAPRVDDEFFKRDELGNIVVEKD